MKVLKAALGGAAIVLGFLGIVLAVLAVILGAIMLVFWLVSLVIPADAFIIGLFVVVGGGWLAYGIYQIVKVSKDVYHYGFKKAWYRFLNSN
jgi:hypothetical protein